jgi:hypothetical protein
MHKSMQTFSVDANRLHYIGITAKAALTSLDLLIHGIPEEKKQEFIQSLTTLVENLPLLTRVTLPSFEDISPILSIASRSTVLRNLNQNWSPVIISSMQDPWSEGDVASVEELSLPQILDT